MKPNSLPDCEQHHKGLILIKCLRLYRTNCEVTAGLAPGLVRTVGLVRAVGLVGDGGSRSHCWPEAGSGEDCRPRGGQGDPGVTAGLKPGLMRAVGLVGDREILESLLA